jgi:hypothetical protein
MIASTKHHKSISLIPWLRQHIVLDYKLIASVIIFWSSVFSAAALLKAFSLD